MIHVTAVMEIKHADMRKAAKACGGQSALARKLSVHPSGVGRWCNLQSCPPFTPTKSWPQNRIDSLELALVELTGKTLEQLFPDELRAECRRIAKPLEFERDAAVESLSLLSLDSIDDKQLLLEPPDELLMEEELLPLRNDAVFDAMETLSYREREILKLRFGFGEDGRNMPLEEVSHVFKITKERVRQIEGKAIRKLQEPQILRSLSEFDE